MSQVAIDDATIERLASAVNGPDEGVARLRASYGEENYERLVELKGKWDPDNLFRLNQNIAPA